MLASAISVAAMNRFIPRSRSPDPATILQTQSSQLPRGRKRSVMSDSKSMCDPQPPRKRLRSHTPCPVTSRSQTDQHHSESPPETSPAAVQGRLSTNLRNSNSEQFRDSPDIYQRMDQEKNLFPGSKDWADDEARLFRILFLREYNPLLPHHWSMDFRGIPIPSFLFSESDFDQPVICSRGGNDFKATRSLIRLIELTSAVRTLAQTGQGDKASPLIRKELDEYAKWAAQDGGYDDLDIIPNLIVDSVDIAAGSEDVEKYMQSRMRTLAAKHRDYWRIDRVPHEDAWKLPTLQAEDPRPVSVVTEPDSSTDCARVKVEDANADELFSGMDQVRYTQRPPVLYGIFVIHHSAMVLSIDSSKEQTDAFVSYQVEAGFNVQYQGVWNAITMAIIICLARDHMITMANDFVQLVGSPDSDPDA